MIQNMTKASITIPLAYKRVQTLSPFAGIKVKNKNMAKTIYTYLHNDDLNGSRVVYMDNCFCKLFKIQRADGDFLQIFKEDLQNSSMSI